MARPAALHFSVSNLRFVMQTALVTGASRGFGQLLAERLAQRGYRVFGTSRVARVSTAAVTMLALDVDDDKSVSACVDQVLPSAGRIDVLVNNAGRLDEGPLEEYSAANL